MIILLTIFPSSTKSLSSLIMTTKIIIILIKVIIFMIRAAWGLFGQPEQVGRAASYHQNHHNSSPDCPNYFPKIIPVLKMIMAIKMIIIITKVIIFMIRAARGLFGQPEQAGRVAFAQQQASLHPEGHLRQSDKPWGLHQHHYHKCDHQPLNFSSFCWNNHCPPPHSPPRPHHHCHYSDHKQHDEMCVEAAYGVSHKELMLLVGS